MNETNPDRRELEPETEPTRESAPESSPKPSPPKRSLPPKQWIFFGLLAAIFVVAYCVVNVDSFSAVFKRIGSVISPVVIGCVIAYMCNPILKFYEYMVFRKLSKKSKLRLGLSLLCTFLSVLGILAIIIAMIIPELYKSISDLVTNYESYLNGLLSFVQSFINKLPAEVSSKIDISDMEKLTNFITEVFGDAETIMSGVRDTLKNYVFEGDLIGNIWAFLSKIFGTIVDFVLGIFIAFYILSSKEKRVAQINKFRAAFFNEKQDGKITEVVSLVDKTFGGFFKGVLLDAVAVGVMTYILLTIFRVSEYNLLIATICAVTNVIPVFGPLIGAVPSGLIVLMTNPEKIIIFIVLILVIQQLDGNILVPLIQGNNTGISSLAVLVSITVMGGLFGIGGMVIGVPVFAVIIELVKRAIENRLRKQNMVTDTTHYYRKGAIGNAEEEVYYEHAHWKYKYDHSKIKPHVDKVWAAIKRIAGKINRKISSTIDAILPGKKKHTKKGTKNSKNTTNTKGSKGKKNK